LEHSDEDDDDDDDEEALVAELERIKRERAEEKIRKVRFSLHSSVTRIIL
jgi:protein CWC15